VEVRRNSSTLSAGLRTFACGGAAKELRYLPSPRNQERRPPEVTVGALFPFLLAKKNTCSVCARRVPPHTDEMEGLYSAR